MSAPAIQQILPASVTPNSAATTSQTTPAHGEFRRILSNQQQSNEPHSNSSTNQVQAEAGAEAPKSATKSLSDAEQHNDSPRDNGKDDKQPDASLAAIALDIATQTAAQLRGKTSDRNVAGATDSLDRTHHSARNLFADRPAAIRLADTTAKQQTTLPTEITIQATSTDGLADTTTQQVNAPATAAVDRSNRRLTTAEAASLRDSKSTKFEPETKLHTADNVSASKALVGKTIASADAALADQNAPVTVSGASHSNTFGLDHLGGLSGSIEQTAAAKSNTATFNQANQTSLSSGAWHVATPVGSPHWGQALGRQLVTLGHNADGTTQSAELRLDPPELGPLRVSLTLSDGVAHASFSSPHANVRQAIESSMQQLQNALSQAGISLGQTNVSDQGAAEQFVFNQAGREQSGLSPEAPPISTEEITPPVRTVRHDALIDTFA